MCTLLINLFICLIMLITIKELGGKQRGPDPKDNSLARKDTLSRKLLSIIIIITNKLIVMVIVIIIV